MNKCLECKAAINPPFSLCDSCVRKETDALVCTSTANERQVGGNHYQAPSEKEQHWDRIWRLYGRGYFVGCITKYLERYHLKNGVQDLEKAKHYLEKLIELESQSLPQSSPQLINQEDKTNSKEQSDV